MPPFVVRDATPGDLPSIVAIYNSTIASRVVTADLEPVRVEDREAWFAAHSPHRRPLWMIEDREGTLIGWASFQDFYGRPAYDATAEVSIYLSEGQRGKGWGRAVLQYCMDKAPSLGIKTLLGFIFAHNTSSLRLFEQAGFEEWGMLPHIAVLDGVERSLKIVGKRVG